MHINFNDYNYYPLTVFKENFLSSTTNTIKKTIAFAVLIIGLIAVAYYALKHCDFGSFFKKKQLGMAEEIQEELEMTEEIQEETDAPQIINTESDQEDALQKEDQSPDNRASSAAGGNPALSPNAPQIVAKLTKAEARAYENRIFENYAKVAFQGKKFTEISETELLDAYITIVSKTKKIREAWIRSKIPQEERQAAIKTSLLVGLYTNKWRKASLEQLQRGDFDKEISETIKACCYMRNRWGMHLIAYSLFSRLSRYYEDHTLFSSLKALLYDELSSLQDVAFVLGKCYEKWKTIDKKWFIKMSENESKRVIDRYWTHNLDGSNKLNPKERVFFSHGGGFFHFIDILKGRSAGYLLENWAGYGLQVHPARLDTTKDGLAAVEDGMTFKKREVNAYAPKAARFFDYPVRVLGETKAEYLVSAPNNYEAGIHAGDLRDSVSRIEVEVLKIRNLDLPKANDEYRPRMIPPEIEEDKLDALFPDHPEIIKAILNSFKRLS